MTYKGKEIGHGKWPAIVAEDDWPRVMELLSRNPTPAERGRKHLLTGIAVCGRCGEKMRSIPGKGNNDGKDYSCPGCYLRRRMDKVDEVVTTVVIERLSQPDATSLLSAGASQTEVREAWGAVEGLRARLRRLTEVYAEGAISDDQLLSGTAALRPKLEAAEQKARSLATNPDLVDMAAGDVAAKWAAPSLERRRAVMDALMAVTVMPLGRGVRSVNADVESVPK